MTFEFLQLLLLCIGSLLVGSFIGFLIYKRSVANTINQLNDNLSQRIKDKTEELESYVQKKMELAETDKKGIEKIIEEKRNRIINTTSISFHFVAKEEIQNFYNDSFREPTIESLVSEITGEKSGEIKGSIPKFIEAKIGGRDISKWISTIKIPDTSLPKMFTKYLKKAIERNEINLGLEELDIELNEYHDFNSIIRNLNLKYEFKIDSEIRREQELKLLKKASEKTLQRLEDATGWVLIEGKFKICRTDKMYECVLIHPVNRYLHEEKKIVTIIFSIPIESIESRYASNYESSVDQMIPLRVFGKVWQPINRRSEIWDLKITPFAVY